MNIIRGHRRPPKELVMPDGTQEVVDFGFVGDVDCVDGTMLAGLIEQGAVPVVAPLSHDGKGSLLNTNADTIASEVACALSPFYNITLTYCFEKRGVLRDADREESVIPVINESDFQRLMAEGVVSGGMIPKLENAFQSLHKGVSRVIITRADYSDGTGGTLITF